MFHKYILPFFKSNKIKLDIIHVIKKAKYEMLGKELKTYDGEIKA